MLEPSGLGTESLRGVLEWLLERLLCRLTQLREETGSSARLLWLLGGRRGYSSWLRLNDWRCL